MDNRYVAVVSVDALVREDLPLLLGMKNCASLFGDCAVADRMRTVYPSLTHPVHASLLSGRACGGTGVVHNERFQPFAAQPSWYNLLTDIRCETIFHAARRRGLSACAARWPVTARGNDCIDYLVPEVLDGDLTDGDMEAALVRGGAGPIWESVARPNLRLLDGNARPGYDAFSAACAADIVRKYRPNLLLTHWGMVDSARHRRGVFGPHIKEALSWIDKWIGWLAAAYREAGIAERTDLILVSDHGQLDVSRKACLNVLFAENGLLRTDARGRLAEWDAFAVGGGLSAQIYLRRRDDAGLYRRVRALLSDRLSEERGGFFRLLTADEARKEYGLYGGFSFVAETDGQTLFGNELQGAWMRGLNAPGEAEIRAAHGHMPHKGPQPPFVASGPSFRPGARLAEGSVLDVAPTIAAILGLDLPEAEGKPMRELLR